MGVIVDKKEKKRGNSGRRQRNPYPFSLGHITPEITVSKNLLEMLSASSKMNREIVEAASRFLEISKISLPITPPLLELLNLKSIISNEAAKSFLENYRGYFSNIGPLLQNVARFAKNYDDATIFLQDIEKSYVPFWQYWPITFLRDFAEISRKDTEVQETHLVNYLLGIIQQQGFIDEFEALICKSEIHKKRWKIIEKAYQLHTEGDYLASIPILLAQVEGVLRDTLALNDIVIVQGRKTYPKSNNGECEELFGLGELGKLVRERESELQNDLSFRPFATYILFVLAPERNDILHGRVVDYGKPGLSARLILSISGLAMSNEKTMKDVN